jgi:hypothetical protein
VGKKGGGSWQGRMVATVGWRTVSITSSLGERREGCMGMSFVVGGGVEWVVEFLTMLLPK